MWASPAHWKHWTHRAQLDVGRRERGFLISSSQEPKTQRPVEGKVCTGSLDASPIPRCTRPPWNPNSWSVPVPGLEQAGSWRLPKSICSLTPRPNLRTAPTSHLSPQTTTPWYRGCPALVFGTEATGPPHSRAWRELEAGDPTQTEALSHYPILEPLSLLHCPVPTLTGRQCWEHYLDVGRYLCPFQGNDYQGEKRYIFLSLLLCFIFSLFITMPS